MLNADTGSLGLVMVDFHVRLQHLIQIEYFHAAAHRHAHRVADKSDGMVVLHEVLVFRKQRALVRILDVRLQRHQAFLARLLQQFIHHLQGIDVALACRTSTIRMPR